MKRVACLALLTLVACDLFPPQPAPDTLTVLSYNIHHGEGNDGVFDLERLARVILASDADLVALQEVDVGTGRAGGVDQAQRLAELTGMRAVFGTAIEYDGGAYGDAVLTRLPLLRSEAWKLPAAPNHEERVAVMVEAELRDGRAIRFIGTHLDHTRDPADRIRQAESLLAQAFPEGESPLPTLLLGDLNAEPGSQPIAVLERVFRSAAPDGIASYPSEDPQKSIDWVMLHPGGAWEVLEIEALNEPLASDHSPVRAVLRLRR